MVKKTRSNRRGDTSLPEDGLENRLIERLNSLQSRLMEVRGKIDRVEGEYFGLVQGVKQLSDQVSEMLYYSALEYAGHSPFERDYEG